MSQCRRVDCSNEAGWFPVLKLFADMNHPPATMPLSDLTTCDDCKAKLVLDDVMGDEGFDQICMAMRAAGYAEPVRELTVLEWEPIT